MILTHLHDAGNDPRVEEAKRILQSGLGGSYFRHSAEIERFMDGLTILEPGVANVTEWRPDDAAGPLEHPAAAPRWWPSSAARTDNPDSAESETAPAGCGPSGMLKAPVPAGRAVADEAAARFRTPGPVMDQ